MGTVLIVKGANFSANNVGKLYLIKSFSDAITAKGGTLSQTEKDAVQKLIDDFVSAGIWTKFNAIYPFVGSSPAAHAFNLKDPRDLDAAYRLTFTGSNKTHTSAGFNGGGNGYADTFILPTTPYKHMAFYNTSSAVSNGIPFGVLANGGSNLQLWVSRQMDNLTSTLTGLGGTKLNADVAYDKTKKGLIIGQRTGPNEAKLYDAGAVIATKLNDNTGVSITNNTNTIRIGGVLNGSSVMSFYQAITMGFVSYGDPLTDSEVAAMNTAVLAFQTTLGRA